MADLGVGFYRFSLAWPRLQPDGRGRAERRQASTSTRGWSTSCSSAGITPWVTLYHWDLPQVLEDAGGWPERDTAYRFADYADAGVRRDWATGCTTGPRSTSRSVPACSATPPASTPRAGTSRSPRFAAAHHLLLGHGLALDALRRRSTPRHQFGSTLNLSPVSPATDAEADIDAARRIDGLRNRLFLDPVLRGRYPADLIRRPGPLTTRSTMSATATSTSSGSPSTCSASTTTRPTWSRPAPGTSTDNTGYVGAGDVDFVPAGRPAHRLRLGDRPRRPVRRCWCGSTRTTGAPPLWITENGAAYHDRPDSDGAVRRPRPDRLSRQPLPGCAPSDPGWRRPARLLRLDTARQLRVVVRLVEPLRPRARGLRHATPDPQGQRSLVRPGHSPKRPPGESAVTSRGTIRTVLGDLDVRSDTSLSWDYHEHLFQVSPLLPGEELDDPDRSRDEAAASRQPESPP